MSRKLGCHDIWRRCQPWLFPLLQFSFVSKIQNFNTSAKIAGILSWKCVDQDIRWWTAVQWTLESANFICNLIAYMTARHIKRLINSNTLRGFCPGIRFFKSSKSSAFSCGLVEIEIWGLEYWPLEPAGPFITKWTLCFRDLDFNIF